MIDLHSVLGIAIKGGASDVHLKVGLPPVFRVNGELAPLRNGPRLTAQDVLALAQTLLGPEQRAHFDQMGEVDFAYYVQGLGRFRVNLFRQRQQLGLVMRVIPSNVQTISDLGLPATLETIASEQRGLVLVTGATGSGKSTTLAALIQFINQNRSVHVLTIEDPIEFMFRDQRSIINQREVGIDTGGFVAALRSALRQDPDVILVGEMRDLETVETAIAAAETGHLVLSTLHTVDASETINRVIALFPPHQQESVRLQLASILRAVISQRLVRRADGRGRVAALEIMLITARIREILGDESRLLELREAIGQGHATYGMQTFDQALMDLLRRGVISREEALNNSTNRDDFLLRLSGVQGASDGQWNAFEG